MNSFTFNGQCSDEFGLYISKKDIYSAPARDQTFVSVPGRNGDVLFDNNRYENASVSYTVSCKNISDKATAIKLWLCTPGYFPLTDTYQPDYFRYAALASNLNIDEVLENVGQAKIVFNCKPFRYSNAGQTKRTLTSSGTLINPEGFSSQPYMKITGSGNITLYIGDKSYYITSVSSYIELDCELMSAYKGSTLCNSQIGFTEFPELAPGNNTISWSGSVSKIEIIPRWRTL